MNFEFSDLRSAMKNTVYKNTIEDIRREIANEKDIHTIVATVVDKVTKAAQAQAGTFWLYKEETDFIVPYACADGKELKGVVLRPNEGVAGKCIATNTSVLVDNVENNANWSSKADGKTGFVTKSMICAPVVFLEKTIGCLQLVNHVYNDIFENKDVIFIEELIQNVVDDIEKNEPILEIIKNNSAIVKKSVLENEVNSMLEVLYLKDFDALVENIKVNPIYKKMTMLKQEDFLEKITDIYNMLNENKEEL